MLCLMQLPSFKGNHWDKCSGFYNRKQERALNIIWCRFHPVYNDQLSHSKMYKHTFEKTANVRLQIKRRNISLWLKVLEKSIIFPHNKESSRNQQTQYYCSTPFLRYKYQNNLQKRFDFTTLKSRSYTTRYCMSKQCRQLHVASWYCRYLKTMDLDMLLLHNASLFNEHGRSNDLVKFRL